ncbi:MAG TPA: metal ABC transporter ATP-binding protein [Candidatus Nanoarchaeia archaeon]|nr:metal ABC transporter ATP-binding protein [Candidatus Nanoarchaeia archaeon]
MNAVEIKNLTVSYDRQPVIRSISFAISQKQIVGIIGPNGAGKSTLLKAMVGLLRTDSGEISIFGKQVIDAKHLIAYIPQRSEIDWDFPVTVQDVVIMGRYKKLGLFKRPKKIDHEIVKKSLREVGMLQYSERSIGQLSGGQQQRVFIARALAQQTPILMLDEPFVGIDAATEKSIWQLLNKLKRDKTIIVVNHNLTESVKNYDRVALINQRLIAYGSPSILNKELIQKTYSGRLTLLEEMQ